MPEEKSEAADKRYYSIGEVAERFAVRPSLIRFWEKEFDILQPRKTAQGKRLFTPKDLENFKLIYHLVKERGFTLKGAKTKLRENREDTARLAEAVEKLKNVRQALAEMRQNL